RAGIEARVVPANGIPLHFITIGGLRGKGLLKKLAAPLVILWATLQSLTRIASLRPQCVLGMGGFVCGPGGLAARMLGRKLLIHEQNAVAGLTNQLLSSVATQVLEAFPGAFERKRALSGPVLRRWGGTAKPVLVGNPVRAELLELPPPGQRLGERSGS